MVDVRQLKARLEQELAEADVPETDDAELEAVRHCGKIVVSGVVSVTVSLVGCDRVWEMWIREKRWAMAVRLTVASLVVTSSQRDRSSGRRLHASEILTLAEMWDWKNSGKTRAMAAFQRGKDASGMMCCRSCFLRAMIDGGLGFGCCFRAPLEMQPWRAG